MCRIRLYTRGADSVATTARGGLYVQYVRELTPPDVCVSRPSRARLLTRAQRLEATAANLVVAARLAQLQERPQLLGWYLCEAVLALVAP